MIPEVTLAFRLLLKLAGETKSKAFRLSVVKNFSLFFPVTLTYDANVDPTLKLIQPLWVRRRRVAKVSRKTTFTWVPCVFCCPCWAQLI